MIIDFADTLAMRGKGPLSEAIAKITGSEVSHVGIVTGWTCPDIGCIDPAHIIVTQALAQGIVGISLEESIADAEEAFILHDPTLTQEDRGKMVAYALNQAGIKYANANLFWEAVDILTHDEKWTIFLDDGQREICSQYVALCALAADRDFGISPRVCRPSTCLDYARAHEWLIQPMSIKPRKG